MTPSWPTFQCVACGTVLDSGLGEDGTWKVTDCRVVDDRLYCLTCDPELGE